MGVLVLLGMFGVGALGYAYHLAEEETAAPMSQAEAAQVAGPVEAKAARLVIVVVDAAREDLFLDAEVMPELAQLAKGGRRGVSMTQPITMTLLSVLNLGTGVTPGLGWSVQNFEADAFGDESLFYWAKAKGLGVAFVGDAAWSQLYGRWSDYNKTFPDGGLHDEVVEGGLTRKDAEALVGAREVLGDRTKYQVVVVHLVSTDKISHKRGALVRDDLGRWTPYADVAHRIDAEIGALHRDFWAQGDVWFITSDHGATDWGNHGGGEDVARRAPFVWVGEGVLEVRSAQAAEVALNVWSPTLATLLGLPIPRRAEAAAALELLDLTQAEREGVLMHHAERRLEAWQAIGGDPEDILPGAEEGVWGEENARRVIGEVKTRVEGAKERRQGYRVAGEGVGAMVLVMGLVLLWVRRMGASSPGRIAVMGGWVVGLTLLLGYDDWLYVLVEWLGGLGWQTAVMLAGVGLVGWLVWRALEYWFHAAQDKPVRDGIGWIVWGVGVVATSQIVVKWPFGPLTETFLALWTGLVLAVGVWVWRMKKGAREGQGECALWLAAGVAGWWVIWWLGKGAHLQTMPEGAWTGLVSWVALAGVAGWLGRGFWVSGQKMGVARGLLGLGVAAAGLYRVVGEPWAAWTALALLGAQAVGIWSQSRDWNAQQKRAGVWVLALALGHVMASDWVSLVWLAAVPLWVALTKIPWRSMEAGAGAFTWTVALLDISLFYLIGYRYSFSAMDVQVVFMLDHEGINLGVGLLLMMMQQAPPWLMSWGAAHQNGLGGRATLWALLVVIALRCWGPFWGLAYHAENFWFVSHAVPMFVISLSVGGVILGCGWVAERLWLGREAKATLKEQS